MSAHIEKLFFGETAFHASAYSLFKERYSCVVISDS